MTRYILLPDKSGIFDTRTGKVLGIISGGTSPVYTQRNFRGRNDDNSETLATWKATANTNFSQDVDTNFRIRFSVRESNGKVQNNVTLNLQYNLGGAGWNNVTTTSSVVRAFSSMHFTQDDHTTQQIDNGTFLSDNLGMSDTGITGTYNHAASGETECEFCVQIRGADVNNNDTIQLRVIMGTTVLNTYTNTPTVTVIKAAPEPVTISLSSATVAASGQAITINAPLPEVNVNLQSGNITASGQILDVVPGETIVNLGAANLVAAGQNISVIPGSVSIDLSTANAVSNGQSITISAPVPGLDINLSTASLIADGQNLTIIPGDIDVHLISGNLLLSGQTIDVLAPSPGEVINLSVGTLTSDGQSLGVVAGAVSLQLSNGNLLASGQNVSIAVGGVSIQLSIGNLFSDALNTSIIPGESIVNLEFAQLLSNGKQIEVISVVPGVINLGVASLTSDGQKLSIVPNGVIVALSHADLIVSSDNMIVLPGTYTAQLAASEVNAYGQELSVMSDKFVDLMSAEIIAIGETINVIIPVTTAFDRPTYKTMYRGRDKRMRG